MGKDNLLVTRFFVATILLSLVGAYVAAHHLPNIWHLLDLMAFFAVLVVPFTASKKTPS